jgi:hypothetical protein
MIGNTAANNTAADDNDLSLSGYFPGHKNLPFNVVFSIVCRK